MAPTRIEPATFRFVTQCLSQLRHQVDRSSTILLQIVSVHFMMANSGALKIQKVNKSSQSTYFFFPTCMLKSCEAPKNSQSTFSSEDGNSPGFRNPCLFIYLFIYLLLLLLLFFGKIMRRRKFETCVDPCVDPNTRRVQFFSASVFPEIFFVTTFTELHSGLYK